MEHPSIDVSKIKNELTLEEIQTKNNEIFSRLRFAYSTNNQALIYQLEMTQASYDRAMQEKLHEMFNKNDNDGGGAIDIT